MDGFRLRWSKKENDWLFEYNDNAGKSLMGLFFDMIHIEKNIDWLKKRFIGSNFDVDPPILPHYEEIPEDQRDTLIKQLTERGFDYTTLRITCKKLKDNPKKVKSDLPEDDFCDKCESPHDFALGMTCEHCGRTFRAQKVKHDNQ